MKTFLLICLVLFPVAYFAQSDSLQIAKLVNRSLELISGEKGVKRDWDSFRKLFSEDARFVFVQAKKDSAGIIHSLSVEDFIRQVGPQYPANGFLEYETGLTMEIYNGIAIVFQSYIAESENYHDEGINSYQLVFDGVDWKIICLTWAGNGNGVEIPGKYIKEK